MFLHYFKVHAGTSLNVYNKNKSTHAEIVFSAKHTHTFIPLSLTPLLLPLYLLPGLTIVTGSYLELKHYLSAH